MADQGKAQHPFYTVSFGGSVSKTPLVTESESLVSRESEGRTGQSPELASLHQPFFSLPSLVPFVGKEKKNFFPPLSFFLKRGAVSCHVKDLEEAD